MSDITKAERDELRARLATSGRNPDADGDPTPWTADGGVVRVPCRWGSRPLHDQGDAELAAAAVNALPGLLDLADAYDQVAHDAIQRHQLLRTIADERDRLAAEVAALRDGLRKILDEYGGGSGSTSITLGAYYALTALAEGKA